MRYFSEPSIKMGMKTGYIYHHFHFSISFYLKKSKLIVFLHPIEPKTDGEKFGQLLPDAIHHTIEDILTNFHSPTRHILPLRRMLEHTLQKDLKNYSTEACAVRILSSKFYFYHSSSSSTVVVIPVSCRRYLGL